MGKKTLMETKEQLEQELEDIKNTYQEEYDQMIVEINKSYASYNNDISVLNSRRSGLYGTIKKLSDFLIKFGNITKITPFDGKNEDIISPISGYDDLKVEESEISIHGKEDLKKNSAAGKTADAVLTLLVPEIGLPVAAIKTIKRNRDNKKMIEDDIRTIEGNIWEYAKVIDHLLHHKDIGLKKIKEARNIIRIYQGCIDETKELIETKIFPEFDAVCCFLMAESAVETIICQDEDEIKTELYNKKLDIKSLKTSSNPQHKKFYNFFENTVAYYDLICGFYTKTVISDMMKDMEITLDERRAFNKQKQSIKASAKKLEDSIVLTSGR